MDSAADPPKGGGCPIRRSSDHSLLAAPQGFSQRATSFIASWRQGIHQMPLLSSAPTSDNHTITPPGLRPGGDPARRRTAPTKRRQMRRPPPGTIPASTANYKCWPIAGRSQQAASIPMPNMRPATDGSRGQARMTCRRPPHHDACQDRSCHARDDGHLVTTSRCPRNIRHRTGPTGPAARKRGTSLRAAGPGPGPRRPHLPVTGKRGLVGLGRLERPTSRLSGVRSNQLSYRPERHPAGPEAASGEGRANPRPPTRGPRVRRLCAKGRADGGGRFYPRR